MKGKSLNPLSWWKRKKRPEFEFVQFDGDFIVEFAKSRRNQLENEDQHLMDNVISMSKWLTSSLLVLNGGALAALLNSGQNISEPRFPAIMFLVGIFGALLNGWLIQMVGVAARPWILEAKHYWTFVASGLEQDAATEQLIWEKTTAVQRFAKFVSLPGWISTLAFAAGVVAATYSFHH